MKWFKSDKEQDTDSRLNADGTKTVICPHCDFEQSVSSKIELTFCKNCNKIINTKQLATQPKKIVPKKTTLPEPETTIESKIIKEQIKPISSTKTVLKETKEAPKEPEKPKKIFTPVAPPPPIMPEPIMTEAASKEVVCSHCKTTQKVPAIALSSFCKKCGQRINLQDYEIKGKFQGELETRGVICVAQGADVTAEINVGSAVIEGKVRGNIVAETVVELKETGVVFGTITSPVLLVDDGAIFVGKAIINPKPEKK